jgi:hypothetical protein
MGGGVARAENNSSVPRVSLAFPEGPGPVFASRRGGRWVLGSAVHLSGRGQGGTTWQQVRREMCARGRRRRWSTKTPRIAGAVKGRPKKVRSLEAARVGSSVIKKIGTAGVVNTSVLGVKSYDYGKIN